MMRYTIFLSLMISLWLSACSTKETSLEMKWKLDWEENFEGEELDTSIWSRIPRGTYDWKNYMSPNDSCYELRNGFMILKGLKNTFLPEDTAQFLTGGIFTKDKKMFGEGKLVIRAKLESATGAWPAIWMLPKSAKWPYGGEIDIMEHLNYDTIAYQTVHSEYTYVLGNMTNPVSHGTNSIQRDKFNEYSVEIHADSLIFAVNGNHTFTYPRIETSENGQFPFTDQPFYLLIDMQLGGDWVGAINSEELPVAMEIDWVKFYKKKIKGTVKE